MTRPRLIGLAAAMVLALAAAACGSADQGAPEQAAEQTTPTTSPLPPATTETSATKAETDATTTAASDAGLARRPGGTEGLRVAATRAKIVARDSQLGRVLFDANGQVVYVFENDRPNRSNCTSDDCVKAWPPVLTRQPPTAGAGVNDRLLRTVRRADGRLQVTYNGRPLYFYEHEGPGEIRCHNVDLNGGLWWVITPQGDPAV